MDALPSPKHHLSNDAPPLLLEQLIEKHVMTQSSTYPPADGPAVETNPEPSAGSSARPGAAAAPRSSAQRAGWQARTMLFVNTYEKRNWSACADQVAWAKRYEGDCASQGIWAQRCQSLMQSYAERNWSMVERLAAEYKQITEGYRR